MAKRDIFGELMEGIAAMNGSRARRIALHSYKVEPASLPKVTPAPPRKVDSKPIPTPARHRR